MSEILTENATGKKVEDFYMNTKEACNFLNLAKPTIYSLTSKRKIPFIKKGKKLYFKKADLEVWLNEGKKKTTFEIEIGLDW
ncbi:MAG TPA: helix-turn-helix domain-containing protein [Chitinophagaceae bacterium]|nr:helix-turn-helix domain-containing protein [Chitinophagaceae bacterium]